ncbi:hypothetical protein AV530_015636 [Patagioenas fasciata monilis]|uniref:Uncharacterized protein n=1 Tax=Patagioenas fasciata monilis TaxID=372326 RepID=A0A1V4KI49_PATFA|nr:hypothetical protein AV530_015636 [Patagioenas fasciata monilis]
MRKDSTLHLAVLTQLMHITVHKSAPPNRLFEPQNWPTDTAGKHTPAQRKNNKGWEEFFSPLQNHNWAFHLLFFKGQLGYELLNVSLTYGKGKTLAYV